MRYLQTLITVSGGIIFGSPRHFYYHSKVPRIYTYTLGAHTFIRLGHFKVVVLYTLHALERALPGAGAGRVHGRLSMLREWEGVIWI